MAMFKAAAREQQKLLLVAFVLANSYRMLVGPSSAANNACGSELHLRVGRGHDLLVLAALPAGMLLLAVTMAVDAAEASAVAFARARAAERAKDFDAVGAAAAAAAKGLRCVAAGWKRVSLHAVLLVAVGLSFVATCLAVVVFEDGFLYRTGCPAVDGRIGSTSPVAVALMALMALLHAGFAWAAVSKN